METFDSNEMKKKKDSKGSNDFWEMKSDPLKFSPIDENNCSIPSENCRDDSELKWNRYNYIKKNEDNEYLLYNCSTNNHMYMVASVKKIITDNLKSIHAIESIYPELYHFLKIKKFIVNKNFDEVEDAIIRMKNIYNSPAYFEIQINPTLDCNLKCWYCTQFHQKKTILNDETLKSILFLITKKIESPELKQITISFFGGEPLIGYNKVIWPIIDYTNKLCTQNNKKLFVYFNTNGVLLTRKIVDQLYSAGIYCSLQVAFDGNEEYHNKTKKYSNGKGTFNIIMNNIMYALSKGFRFNIRCNYTSENLHSFDELISIFTEYASECIRYRSLIFTYHKVWQAKRTAEMVETITKYEQKTNLSDITFYPCYADRENCVVINYNGDVFNCTANDFRTEDREGYLAKDGEIIHNEKHQKRMNMRFSNKHCLDCLVFPICMTCSKIKLENQNKEVQCYRVASDAQKEELLLKKIQTIFI